MAVRQYIGARYVTKIYENSLDPSSAEWEAGVTYEPLTMVTYLNSSYLSKKEVPGSVGDPAANPSYWVVTGAYNGQIVTLQNQIDAINAKLSVINKRRFIFISDSFGNYTDGDGNNFMQAVKTRLNLADDDCYITWQSGQGFWGDGFLTLLQAVSATDPDSITDIVVIGGNNDVPHYNDISTPFASFVSYANANYKNAKITLLYDVYHPFDPGSAAKRMLPYNYKALCLTHMVNFVEDFNACIHYYDAVIADGIHPSSSGVSRLADGLENWIINGMPFYDSGSYAMAFKSGENAVVQSGALRFKNLPQGANLFCTGACRIDITTPITVAADGGTAIVGAVSSMNVNAQTDYNCWFNVKCLVRDNGTDSVVDLAFSVTEGKLNVMNLTHAALTSLTRITLLGFTAFFGYELM